MTDTKSDAPLFSVIIPTFNRANTIARAVRSVLRQTYRDFELIVVDDGSTDETRAIVEGFSDARLRYVYQTNRGRSAARNAGVALARGGYVTFLDSDDEALPLWLERMAAATRETTGVICCGVRALVEESERGEIREVISRPRPLGPAFEGHRGLFVAGSFAVRKSLFDAAGGYAGDIIFSENTELALRVLPICGRERLAVHSIDEPLIVYHKRTEKASSAADFHKLLDNSEAILRRHGTQLRKDRRVCGNFYAVAGVRAAKALRYDRARSHLTTAVLTDPLNWRHYPRLLFSMLPPLGRRVWNAVQPNRARDDRSAI